MNRTNLQGALACTTVLCLLLTWTPGTSYAADDREQDADVVLARQALDAPDPGQPGAHDVLTLYYGSGNTNGNCTDCGSLNNIYHLHKQEVKNKCGLELTGWL